MKIIKIFKITGIILTGLFLSGCSMNIEGDLPITTQNSMHEPLYHLLDTNGDQSGSNQATGDYSLTPTKFYIKPDSNEKYSLARLLIHIEDTGSFDANKYGNNVVLTNGIIIYVKINGITYNLTNSHPIKSNTDYGGLMFDAQPLNFGIGDESLNARFTFTKAGQDLILDGAKGDEFGVLLNDDFTGINQHHFQVQGKIISNKIYTIN